jgi:hypothetical protein
MDRERLASILNSGRELAVIRLFCNLLVLSSPFVAFGIVWWLRPVLQSVSSDSSSSPDIMMLCLFLGIPTALALRRWRMLLITSTRLDNSQRLNTMAESTSVVAGSTRSAVSAARQITPVSTTIVLHCTSRPVRRSTRCHRRPVA